jgi:hypothetical protein
VRYVKLLNVLFLGKTETFRAALFHPLYNLLTLFTLD